MKVSARRLGIATAASLLLPLLAWTPRPAQAIVGGRDVPITSFPFQVALYDPAAESVYEGQFCGGVILDATHVATAAHCVFEAADGHARAPEAVAVLAGTAHLNAAGEGAYPETVEQDLAAWVSFDPGYEPELLENDVAVVTLTDPLYAGSPAAGGETTIAPIALVSGEQARTIADPNLTPAPAVALSGFGDTHAEDAGPPASLEYPQELHAVETHLVAEATCAKQYESLVPITSAMICAGEPEGGRDACYGDSGGPLVVDTAEPADPPGDYALLGLTDFAEGCALAGYAGIYARVSEPAIRAFLESSPPPAPRAIPPPTLGGEAEVGGTLSCSGSEAPSGTVLDYRFFATVDGEAVALDEAASSGELPLGATDAGDSVFCRVQASGAGGYAFADSPPVTVSKYGGPAPAESSSAAGSTGSISASPWSAIEAEPDRPASPAGSAQLSANASGASDSPPGPWIVLMFRDCRERACTVIVRIAADRGYHLRATLRPATRSGCRHRSGHCRDVFGRAAVTSRAGGRFSLRISGLAASGRRPRLRLSVMNVRGQALQRLTIALPRNHRATPTK